MPTDPLFHMFVHDVFSITGRGTVVTGMIDKGTVRTGDEILIHRPGVDKKAVVTGIEKAQKMLNEAGAGDTVGVLLRDVSRQDVQRGDELISPEGFLTS